MFFGVSMTYYWNSILLKLNLILKKVVTPKSSWAYAWKWDIDNVITQQWHLVVIYFWLWEWQKITMYPVIYEYFFSKFILTFLISLPNFFKTFTKLELLWLRICSNRSSCRTCEHYSWSYQCKIKNKTI